MYVRQSQKQSNQLDVTYVFVQIHIILQSVNRCDRYRGNNRKTLSLPIRSSAITPPPDEVPRVRHTLIPAGGVSAAKPKRKRSQKRRGGKGGSRDECTRKEWKTGGKGGGREEGSTPRYCTRLHGCAHNRTGPRKTPFQVRSPPLKNVLSPLCCSRPFRSNLLNTPDTHLSNADFFETPAVLSPRIIFRRGREIELLPPRGFQIRNYGNYGNVAEDEIF